LQTAAKPLQLATLLLLTVYRNLPTPYPSVPSPTICDVPFSHNTKCYRQTDDRQTDRTSYHKRDRTTHGHTSTRYGLQVCHFEHSVDQIRSFGRLVFQRSQLCTVNHVTPTLTEFRKQPIRRHRQDLERHGILKRQLITAMWHTTGDNPDAISSTATSKIKTYIVG